MRPNQEWEELLAEGGVEGRGYLPVFQGVAPADMGMQPRSRHLLLLDSPRLGVIKTNRWSRSKRNSCNDIRSIYALKHAENKQDREIGRVG